MAVSVVHLRGGYLYQHCPDIMPDGYLTPLEMELWALWYEEIERRQKARGG